jgi:glycosyltransferase involved in cell wall biosynthesis
MKQFPSFSIIICTHNGAKTLTQCLNSLNNQSYPKAKLEILIIDNASTDNTKKIVNRFIKQSKFLSRYIFEPQLGLSTARNTGIKQAGNSLVAFTDDDAIVDKNWLKNLTKGFKTQSVWAVGGKTKLKFKTKPPTWLPQKYLFALGACDLGSKTKPVPYIPGGNMAFRKKIFKTIGFFQPDLGKKGKQLISAEDLEICQRIIQAGAGIFYQPQAIVHHLVSPSHLTKKYFTHRIFNEGISLAKMDKHNLSFFIRFRRLLAHRSRYLISALVKLLIYRRFNYWCDFLLNLGYFAGFFLA